MNAAALNLLLALAAVMVLVIVVMIRRAIASSAEGQVRTKDASKASFMDRRSGEICDVEGIRERVVDAGGASAIALDRTNKRLMVFHAAFGNDPDAAPSITPHVYEWDKIVHMEVREHVVNRPKGDAANPRVLGVELVLVVDDDRDPLVVVDLLDADARPGSERHEEARDLAHLWEAHLRVLKHRAMQAENTREALSRLARPNPQREGKTAPQPEAGHRRARGTSGLDVDAPA